MLRRRECSRFPTRRCRFWTISTGLCVRTLSSCRPIRARARRVSKPEDLLNEFTRRSNQFSYRFVDPELQRSVAQQYGVTSFPSIVFEDLEDGTLQNIESFTEQDFVTSILIVTGVDQKIVYYLTGHDEAAATRDPLSGEIDADNGFDFALAGMQRDNYRVLPLNLKQDASVPENAAVLVIAGPQKIWTPRNFKRWTNISSAAARVIAAVRPDYARLVQPADLAVGHLPCQQAPGYEQAAEHSRRREQCRGARS